MIWKRCLWIAALLVGAVCVCWLPEADARRSSRLDTGAEEEPHPHLRPVFCGIDGDSIFVNVYADGFYTSELICGQWVFTDNVASLVETKMSFGGVPGEANPGTSVFGDRWRWYCVAGAEGDNDCEFCACPTDSCLYQGRYKAATSQRDTLYTCVGVDNIGVSCEAGKQRPVPGGAALPWPGAVNTMVGLKFLKQQSGIFVFKNIQLENYGDDNDGQGCLHHVYYSPYDQPGDSLVVTVP